MGSLQGKDCKVKRKRYSRQFQRMAVERMRSTHNIGHLAKELGVSRRCLYNWQAKLDHREKKHRERTHMNHLIDSKSIGLKLLLAEKTLEVDFFKDVG
jgi:transposase-like protein